MLDIHCRTQQTIAAFLQWSSIQFDPTSLCGFPNELDEKKLRLHIAST